MFVPTLYRPKDPAWADEIVEGHPLALLVLAGSEYPSATHCPIIVDPASPRPLTEEGSLLGHLNRQNPMWDAICGGGRVLVIFQGPGSYISPRHYGEGPAAPTWNFIAVHVEGLITPIFDSVETLGVIEATVDRLEADHGAGWDRRGSAEYFAELLPGVGAFRIAICRVDAMFKLSQEKRRDIREQVSRGVAVGGAQALSHWMNRLQAGAGA
jgi:transcriptional regulator